MKFTSAIAIRITMWIYMRRWKSWLKMVHRLPKKEAMIHITRMRWKVAHGGYREDIESAYMRALAITEESIKQVRVRTCKKRASAHFDLTDV